MKVPFGGLLAMALGTVLIVNGLSQSSDGAVGNLGSQCGLQVGGLTPSEACPVGGITITDTTTPGPGVPADWDVTITSSNCVTLGGNPVNITLTVPTGGSDSTDASALYSFAQAGSTPQDEKCLYTLTREVNPAYTATFTPASPVTLPYADDDVVQGQRVRSVSLENEAVVPTSSAAPSSSSAAPSSSSASASASASASPTEVSRTTSAAASESSSAAPIAETGPSQPVKASLWLGIGLLLLGLFLCFEGRVRKLARRR